MTKARKIFVLLFFMLVANINYSQCDDDAFVDKCSAPLNSYKVITSFEASGKKEFQYVFSKDHSYYLSIGEILTNNAKSMVNLYDRAHKLVGTNYDKKTKKFY